MWREHLTQVKSVAQLKHFCKKMSVRNAAQVLKVCL